MYNCIRPINEWDYRCKARELLGSHGGGTDFGPPCRQNVNEKGKHKGNHIAENGYSWPQSKYDVWLDE